MWTAFFARGTATWYRALIRFWMYGEGDKKQHSPSDKVPFLKRIIKYIDALHNRKAIVLGFHWLALLLIYFTLLYCGRAVTYDKSFGDSYIRLLELSACFKLKQTNVR